MGCRRIIYYFVQYLERHCFSSSGCYKLLISETSSLQIKVESVCNTIWHKSSEK